MKRSFPLVIFGALTLLLFSSWCAAQNVSGYGKFPDPLLFLLREPAVHDDLQLTTLQRAKLVEFNKAFDHVLLGSRNLPGDEGREQVAKVMSQTRKHIATLFSDQQQTRFRQIAHRLRGYGWLLSGDAAKQLELSEKQREIIEDVIQTAGAADHSIQTDSAIAGHAKRAAPPPILEALDDRQRQRLRDLVGEPFDPSRLGRVSFQAPEIPLNEEWINSDALQLKTLRGKVVALHFWAFG